MGFEDLLDEDGQGSRRCDAWLAENIDNWTNIEWVNETPYGYKGNWQHEVPDYTTGDSIDSVLSLAKDYFNYDFAIGWDDEDTAYFESYGKNLDGIIKSNDVKLSIAEALFKAYQKEEN